MTIRKVHDSQSVHEITKREGIYVISLYGTEPLCLTESAAAWVQQGLAKALNDDEA